MRPVDLPQDGRRVWLSRRVGELASKRAGGQWARWSTARDERPGPLAPGLLRLWRRRDGIPTPPGDSPLFGRAGGVHPGAEVCRRLFCLMTSLRIYVPRQVAPPDLRWICCLVRRG